MAIVDTIILSHFACVRLFIGLSPHYLRHFYLSQHWPHWMIDRQCTMWWIGSTAKRFCWYFRWWWSFLFWWRRVFSITLLFTHFKYICPFEFIFPTLFIFSYIWILGKQGWHLEINNHIVHCQCNDIDVPRQCRHNSVADTDYCETVRMSEPESGARFTFYYFEC